MEGFPRPDVYRCSLTGMRFRVSLSMLKRGMELHAWRLRFRHPVFKVTLETYASYRGGSRTAFKQGDVRTWETGL